MRNELFCCLLLLPLLALAQQEMEIVPLRHRTTEQVIPSLQPLVEPGGVLSGFGDQLIIKASRRNLEQLRQALSAIDRPLRRLLIRVSQTREVESRQQGVQVSGDVGFGNNVRIIQQRTVTPGGTQIEVRRGGSVIRAEGGEMRHSGGQQTAQSVQVVEGGRATIRVGRSIPLRFRQVVYGPHGAAVTHSQVYLDVGQGFVAVPQVVGERVSLEISPAFDTLGSGRQIETQRLSTTVSGRLGEWIELGGSQQQSDQQGRSWLGSEGAAVQDNRSIWLQVEELP